MVSTQIKEKSFQIASEVSKKFKLLNEGQQFESDGVVDYTTSLIRLVADVLDLTELLLDC